MDIDQNTRDVESSESMVLATKYVCISSTLALTWFFSIVLFNFIGLRALVASIKARVVEIGSPRRVGYLSIFTFIFYTKW